MAKKPLVARREFISTLPLDVCLQNLRRFRRVNFELEIKSMGGDVYRFRALQLSERQGKVWGELRSTFNGTEIKLWQDLQPIYQRRRHLKIKSGLMLFAICMASLPIVINGSSILIAFISSVILWGLYVFPRVNEEYDGENLIQWFANSFVDPIVLLRLSPSNPDITTVHESGINE